MTPPYTNRKGGHQPNKKFILKLYYHSIVPCRTPFMFRGRSMVLKSYCVCVCVCLFFNTLSIKEEVHVLEVEGMRPTLKWITHTHTQKLSWVFFGSLSLSFLFLCACVYIFIYDVCVRLIIAPPSPTNRGPWVADETWKSVPRSNNRYDGSTVLRRAIPCWRRKRRGRHRSRIPTTDERVSGVPEHGGTTTTTTTTTSTGWFPPTYGAIGTRIGVRPTYDTSPRRVRPTIGVGAVPERGRCGHCGHCGDGGGHG